jgi:hypothetical protein
MAGSMSEADLLADLKDSLQDAAKPFVAASDADFKRHLSLAVAAFNAARPRTLSSSVALQAEVATYAAPADLHRFKFLQWGASCALKPWERGYPGRLPMVHEVAGEAGPELVFSPAPSAEQIAVLGAECRFFYFGRHAIGATAELTTVRPGDRGLLILRAQAEAMRELAMRGVVRPQQTHDGVSGGPAIGSPAALHEQFLLSFSRAVMA